MSHPVTFLNDLTLQDFKIKFEEKGAGILFAVGIAPGEEMVLVTSVEVTTQMAIESLEKVIAIIKKTHG